MYVAPQSHCICTFIRNAKNVLIIMRRYILCSCIYSDTSHYVHLYNIPSVHFSVNKFFSNNNLASAGDFPVSIRECCHAYNYIIIERSLCIHV